MVAWGFIPAGPGKGAATASAGQGGSGRRLSEPSSNHSLTGQEQVVGQGSARSRREGDRPQPTLFIGVGVGGAPAVWCVYAYDKYSPWLKVGDKNVR